MQLEEAEIMAKQLIKQHGLINWSFRFDKAVKRFGCCNFTKKEISLSKKITELNDSASVKDTLLHEIAHALVGPKHGHDAVWKAQASALGCKAERCYSNDVVVPKGKYTAFCKHCGNSQELRRISLKKRLSACGICCKKYNSGSYSWRFRFQFVKNA